MASTREFDLVLFGATGFVGKLTADYLGRAAGDGVRVALAGRSREKLEHVRAGLAERAPGGPPIVADSGNESSLAGMGATARAIATTARPQRKDGMGLL